MEAKAVRNNLIVKIVREELHKTSRGIKMKVDEKVKPNVGIITSIGSSVEEKFEIGEKILFNTHGNIPFDFDDTLLIVNENNVKCILKGE